MLIGFLQLHGICLKKNNMDFSNLLIKHIPVNLNGTEKPPQPGSSFYSPGAFPLYLLQLWLNCWQLPKNILCGSLVLAMEVRLPISSFQHLTCKHHHRQPKTMKNRKAMMRSRKTEHEKFENMFRMINQISFHVIPTKLTKLILMWYVKEHVWIIYLMPAWTFEDRWSRFCHKVSFLTTNYEQSVIGHNTSPVKMVRCIIRSC